MSRKYKNFLILIAVLITALASLLADSLGLFDTVYAKFRLDGNCGYNYVKFLDVGQGDCALVHTNGKYVLIDSGCNYDDGIALSAKLRAYNVRRVDYIIVSHDHADHAGGIYKILCDFPVGAIICSDGAFRDTEETLTQNIISKTEECDIPLLSAKAGDTLDIGNAQFDFLWLDERINENDRCLVFKLTIDKKRFFFGGDITSAVEKRMIKAGVDVSCDVLKASHHGSSTGTCDEFLNAALPGYCVVCCGEDNRYGLPSEEFIKRITERDISLYTTAKHGDITFNTEQDVLETKK